MAHIHLLIGPVGAGKTTHALALAHRHGAVRFDLDEWMVRLFRPDRPDADVMAWYVERAARCIDQIWEVSQEVLATGVDVVLEIGLLRLAQREAFYDRLDQASCATSVYVVDAPRAVRWARVERRNVQRGPTFSMEVPREVFELASDLWEPPVGPECLERDVIFVPEP